MKIEHGYPPNIDEIAKKFDLKGRSPVFTYGDTIYAPDGTNLSDDLMVHEIVHIGQQGGAPVIWWERYLNEPEFRLDQEVEAYATQYAFVCGIYRDRNARARFLWKIAADLSSPMYGNITTHTEAMKLIRTRAGV